jgi:hypothetical protein
MIREREKLDRPAAMNYAALRHYVENNSQLSSTTPESQVTGLESTPAISDLCRDRAQCVANYLQLVDRGRSDYLEPLVRTHVKREITSHKHGNRQSFPIH